MATGVMVAVGLIGRLSVASNPDRPWVAPAANPPNCHAADGQVGPLAGGGGPAMGNRYSIRQHEHQPRLGTGIVQGLCKFWLAAAAWRGRLRVPLSAAAPARAAGIAKAINHRCLASWLEYKQPAGVTGVYRATDGVGSMDQ